MAARLLPGPIVRSVRPLVVRRQFRALSPADALLVSYPKAGSTWLRFILGNVMTGDDTDWDNVRVASPPLGRLSEGRALLPHGGRLVRTHEPLDPAYEPFGRPIVALIRDGRDIALSLLSSMQTFEAARYREVKGATVSEYLPRFLEGWGSSVGPWHEHTARALDAADARPDEVLVVRYEDLRNEPTMLISRILEFVGLDIPPERVEHAVAANTMGRMRSKEKASKTMAAHGQPPGTFVRKGVAGGWKEEFSEADRELFASVAGPVLLRAGYAP